METKLDRPAGRRELMARLAEIGIETTTVDHPALFTVAESSKIDIGLDGAHTKNLFLKDAKGQLYLVVAHAHTRVDLKALPKSIGSARLSFGNAELMESVLGVTPGAVTAFAAMNDLSGRLTVILDRNLMDYGHINAHPLENTATTRIGRDDLIRFLKSTEHDPRIVVLDTGAPQPTHGES